MHINFTFYFCSNFLNNVIANIDEQNKKNETKNVNVDIY